MIDYHSLGHDQLQVPILSITRVYHSVRLMSKIEFVYNLIREYNIGRMHASKIIFNII